MSKHIDNVLSVLAEVMRLRDKDSGSSAEALRKRAMKTIAERGQRYPTTINNACTRQLGLKDVSEFDLLVRRWLNGNSSELQALLEQYARDSGDREEIHRFFTLTPAEHPPLESVSNQESRDERRGGRTRETGQARSRANDGITIMLDDDVAEVLNDPEMINSILRAVIEIARQLNR